MQIRQFRYAVPTSNGQLDYYNPMGNHTTREDLETAIDNAEGVLWKAEGSSGAIVKLGVQGPRNFAFRINGNQDIVLGVTGVFEINQDICGPIDKLELLNRWNFKNVIIDFVTMV